MTITTLTTTERLAVVASVSAIALDKVQGNEIQTEVFALINAIATQPDLTTDDELIHSLDAGSLVREV